MTTTRRHLDQYFTPAAATRVLMRHINLKTMHVLECCNGDGAISRELYGYDSLWTNDIDQSLTADFHNDVTQDWYFSNHAFDYIITNPPFNQAAQIVPLAYSHARVGMAMLLRLSFLEPCRDRARWLQQHPPTQLICIPRISFTGDGKTDNVATAWMLWDKRWHAPHGIKVIPREAHYEH